MSERNSSYMKEVKKAADNLQKAEGVINQDESEIETKRMRVAEKTKEVGKAMDEAKKLQAKVQAEIAKSESIDINEENVLNYVKPSTELHELWLKQEAKRKSIDASVQALKKLYEDKNVRLDVFTDSVRRLASKEFFCIYKKAKLEGMIRKQLVK